MSCSSYLSEWKPHAQNHQQPSVVSDIEQQVGLDCEIWEEADKIRSVQHFYWPSDCGNVTDQDDKAQAECGDFVEAHGISILLEPMKDQVLGVRITH